MTRKITMSDQQDYLKMAEEFYNSPAVSHPVPAKNFRHAFEHMINDGRYMNGFIIEYNGETAGFCAVAKTYSQEAGGIVIWIEDFYIRPEFQSKGLGRECLEYIREYYSEAVRFRLEITAENTGARRLYERMGFEVSPYINMVREQH